jgi:hypothetical protein
VFWKILILLTVKGVSVLKLYKFTDNKKEYWETWDNDDGSHTIHWGELGTEGQSKVVKGAFFKKPEKIIQLEIDERVSNGYQTLGHEFTLLIEYKVDGFGCEADLDKRNRLMERMDGTLGWNGLGHCDGGSIGSNTMELCTFVADFEIAKKVIINDLKDTEFEDFTRIYDEALE